MVAGLTRQAIARAVPVTSLVTALVALACIAPRLSLLVALLGSIVWVARHDDGAGTWGVLYVVLLLILGVLTLLVAGLALIHRLLGA